jgi:predicted metalloprotease with PDZ domain
MEHRNSTILSSTASLARAASGLLGTLSHEFFHSWNVERIRPAMLEPFDFFEANPSDALWFAEGFTSYYDDLFIRRAGLLSDAQYIRGLGGTVNAVTTTTARRYGGPMEMSIRAPFVDAATAIDPTNVGNTFLSYYTWGAGIGLALDLAIRGRYPDKSLDGYMRQMWLRYGAGGRYEVPRPYTVDDLEREFGEYTGDATWARTFFARHVRQGDAPDYPALLAQAGIAVQPANPGAAWLGQVLLDFSREGGRVDSYTQVGSSLHEAGIGRGDLITSIGGIALISDSAWAGIRAARQPGDTAPIVYRRRGVEHRGTVRFAPDPRVVTVPMENATAEQLTFRQGWLRSMARP